jgi:uncharacterized integral membrane protein (TIGR00697 family)
MQESGSLQFKAPTSSPELGIQFKYYFFILALFTATWLISNIAAVKLVSVFGIILTGGFLVFPFTSMLESILVEVYGYKNSRQAIWAGFILNLSFVFFITIVNLIPSSPTWRLGDQFQNILVPGMRIILASLFSFIVSNFLNSLLMAKMKMKSKGKGLLKRIFLSNMASLSVDIILFLSLAFYGTLANSILLQLIYVAYLKKLACQLLFYPLILFLIKKLKAWEGIEIYDYNTKFNPFLLDNVYELDFSKNNIDKKLSLS